MLITETLVLERDFAADLDAVFEAWADPVARQTWSDPSDVKTAVYQEAAFKPGGKDVLWCGPEGSAGAVVECLYADICLPAKGKAHIIFQETIIFDGTRVSIALITVEMTQTRGGCHLRLTDQIVSLAGHDIIDGNRTGYSAALDNLGAWLASIHA